jgi:hypothetical protein
MLFWVLFGIFLQVDHRRASIRVLANGRYLNDTMNDEKANVIFNKHPTKIAVFIAPIRDISAGDELLVAYGKEHCVSM